MYDRQELLDLGFTYVGENVKVFKNSVFVNPQNIFLGDNCQIDDFVHIIASDLINIGKRVHIGAYTSIAGGGKFIIEDYAGLSAGCRIITGSDDFLGRGMTNPCVPEKYRKVLRSFVHIKKHSILGTNTIVFPSVTIEEGCAFSAGSVVKKSTEEWSIYQGNPAIKIGRRRKNEIIRLEAELVRELGY